MLNTLTSDQRQALRMMADRNLGAIVTRFGWTWPVMIRESEEIAGEVIKVLETGEAQVMTPKMVARQEAR